MVHYFFKFNILKSYFLPPKYSFLNNSSQTLCCFIPISWIFFRWRFPFHFNVDISNKGPWWHTSLASPDLNGSYFTRPEAFILFHGPIYKQGTLMVLENVFDKKESYRISIFYTFNEPEKTVLSLRSSQNCSIILPLAEFLKKSHLSPAGRIFFIFSKYFVILTHWTCKFAIMIIWSGTATEDVTSNFDAWRKLYELYLTINSSPSSNFTLSFSEIKSLKSLVFPCKEKYNHFSEWTKYYVFVTLFILKNV